MHTGTEEPPVLDLHFSVEPLGGDRQSPGAQIQDGVSYEPLGKSGGIRATRVLANQAVDLSREHLADPNAFVAVMLLHGACMAGYEYYDRPVIVISRPAASLPQLLAGAEALVISLGPEGVLNTQSRLMLRLPGTMRMRFELAAPMRALVGRTMKVADLHPSIDVHVFIDAQGGNPPNPDGHKHPSGGELLLVLAGKVRDRSLELEPFDLMVSGPLTGHGPAWEKDGGIVMTVSLGHRDD